MKNIVLIIFSFVSILAWSQELEILTPPLPEEVVQEEILDFTDVQPEYMDGVEAMMTFINSNFKFN
jgi:hypothetical protein